MNLLKAEVVRDAAMRIWPKAKIVVTGWNHDDSIVVQVKQGGKQAEGRLHYWMDLPAQRQVIERMEEKLKPRPARPRASRRQWRVGPQRIKPV